MKFNSLQYLLPHGLIRITIGWIKSIVKTKCTTSQPFTTVAVRACETCIDGHFLHPVTEYFSQVIRVGIESAAVSPGVGHLLIG
jgi:hypothetical protein